MNSACARVVLGLVLTLAGATVAGAVDKAPAKKEPAARTEAVLLDHAEYICNNCLFGNSDYYFCFDVNSKILIGHEKIRTQMRKKAPDNLLETRGNKVPIRFDDKYIWIPGPNGKEQKLTQDYTRNLFTFNAACQRAATSR
jgi:hypothetical protein